MSEFRGSCTLYMQERELGADGREEREQSSAH